MLNLTVHTRYALQTFLRRDLRVSDKALQTFLRRDLRVSDKALGVRASKLSFYQPKAGKYFVPTRRARLRASFASRRRQGERTRFL